MPPIARYDLRKCIASFDFYQWLCTVKAMGAAAVSFGTHRVKTTKWTEDQVLKRFRDIIEPGPALVGLPIHRGCGGEQMVSAHQRDFIKRVRAGLPYARLQTVKPPGSHRFTVSLRNIERSKKRNSDRSVWLPFAERIGAHVIEDGSIGVHDRMALYAGAQMNFGVVHGALHLCSFATYPMAMFEAGKARKMFVQNGIAPWTNYPWSLPDQHLIWEDATYDSLMRWFDRWTLTARTGIGTRPSGGPSTTSTVPV